MDTTLYSNFSDVQGQITLALVSVSGRNLYSSKLSCMSLLPARMRMIDSKKKELEWSQDFSLFKSMGIFHIAQGQLTPQSLVRSGRISNSSEILLAHLSRRLTGELIGYPWIRRPSVRPSSVRRPFTFSNIFSSETAWPIKAKFYVEPPWEGGTKVCINGPGHMTNMAAMPIYGKNLKKSSSPETEVL